MFAKDFDSPRWLYVLPNGDVLVAESRSVPPPAAKPAAKAAKPVAGGSANRITLFRDADKDGVPEVRATFLVGLNQPLGMPCSATPFS